MRNRSGDSGCKCYCPEFDVKARGGGVAARGRSRVKQRAPVRHRQMVKGRGEEVGGGSWMGVQVGRWSDLGSREAALFEPWGAHPPTSWSL